MPGTLLVILVSAGATIFLIGHFSVESSVLQRFVMVHNGDLVLTGNTVLTISNNQYIENGNIILQDNATLSLDHSTLAMNLSFPFQYRIQLFQTSRLTASVSNIRGNATFNLQLSNSTSLSLTSTITQNLGLQPSDNSQAVLNNVTLTQSILAQKTTVLTAVDLKGQFSITLLGKAQATVSRATARSLLSKGSSTLTLTNSSAYSIWLADGSKALLSHDVVSAARLSLSGAAGTISLAPGAISNKQIAVSATGFNATFQQCQVGAWSLDASSSQLTIQQSKLDALTSTSSTLVISSSLFNTSLVNGGSARFQGSNSIIQIFDAFQTQITLNPQTLYLAGVFLSTGASFTFSGGTFVRMFTVKVTDGSLSPVLGAHVTVTTTGGPVVDGFTDAAGALVFNLTFQNNAPTYQLKASKSGLGATSPVDLTTQNLIALQLGTGISSLPGSLLIPLLGLVIVAMRTAQRTSRKNLHTAH